MVFGDWPRGASILTPPKEAKMVMGILCGFWVLCAMLAIVFAE